MSWRGFRGTLVFGALAGALLPAWVVLAKPLLGGHAALALYLLAATTLYVAGLATGRARRLGAVSIAGALACAVLLLAAGLAQLALGAALLLGLCRSALLFRSRPARAVATELLLLGGGLAFASFLVGPLGAGGPGLLALALGIWGFFLVQSVFFLIGGVRERRPETLGLDPFELARNRALALLEED